MHPFNRDFVPPRSSADTNQTSNPVSPVPTRRTPYASGFVEYNQTGFINLLNQPVSWDPNLYGWNTNHNMGGIGSSQVFGSPLSKPDFVSDTQPVGQEAQKNKTECNHKQKTKRKKCYHTYSSLSSHGCTFFSFGFWFLFMVAFGFVAPPLLPVMYSRRSQVRVVASRMLVSSQRLETTRFLPCYNSGSKRIYLGPMREVGSISS
ncbi:hypothetical protein Hanom_Chr03g00248221 [Helianthus anomalus]